MSTIDISDLSILLIEPSSTQLKVIMKHLQEEGVGNVEEGSINKIDKSEISIVDISSILKR